MIMKEFQEGRSIVGKRYLQAQQLTKPQMAKSNYSAAENYRNITLRAVMIFYSPIGSRD
jgi:hypothetical protein